MRYFRLKENDLCRLPILSDWKKIDVSNICQERAHLLPRREVIGIETNESTFFAGVMLSPFILFSEEVFNVIKMYKPSMNGRQIILLDSDKSFSKLYYIPIIEKVEVVKDKENGKLEIREKNLRDASIFMENDSREPIINLDIAESLLKRKIRGIDLKSVEIDIV